MAGDWIKMRNNLWDDPRVSQLCDETGSQEAAVIGGLYWLWAAADEHTQDGHMPGLSAAGIDRKTGVKGLGAALVSIGWIADTPGGITITRFDEHNGASAKRRTADAQRKANFRHVSAHDADNTRTDDGQKADGLGQVAELEKRREEGIQREPSVLVDCTADAAPIDPIVDPPKQIESPDPPKRRKPSGYAVPPCPADGILTAYAEELPMLPQVAVVSDARRRAMQVRWREVCAAEQFDAEAGLDWWRWYWHRVGESPFLTGAGPPDRSGRTWQADFDWLIQAAHFARVIEGRYHGRNGSQHP